MPQPAFFLRPAFWLLIQPLVLALALTATGGLALRTEPDTIGYVGVDFSSWRTAASGTRTLGYPALIRIVGAVSPDLAALPYVQLAIHAAAVAMTYLGLKHLGFAPATALLAASTALYSGFFLQYVGVLLPDAPALSLALMTVACLAMVATGGGAAAWIGATAFLALTYHFRPAYLFLIPLAPALGALLAWLRPVAEKRTSWRRLLVGLSLAGATPYVLYCGLRAVTVGHFGLVSFGGYTLVGITGQLLDAPTARDLPPQVRPLADAILERRARTPTWKPPAGYYDLVDNFDPTVWHVAVPAARELYGNDEVLINQRLGELSRGVLRARPGAYVRWLLPAAKHGVTQLFEYSFLDRPGLTLLPLLALCQAVLIARWRQGAGVSAAALSRYDYFFEHQATLALALAFAAAKLALVILVQSPIHRYVAPASIFFPMWLAVALVDRLGRVRAGW